MNTASAFSFRLLRYLVVLTWLVVFAWKAGGVEGDLRILGEVDRAAPLFPIGEPMTFVIRLEKDGRLVADSRLLWTRSGDDGVTEKGEVVSSPEPLQITTSGGRAGFVRVVVDVLDAEGKPVVERGRKISFAGGAGVRADALQGVAEPEDFDAYWAAQKAALAQVPLEVLGKTALPEIRAGVETFDVKISSAGGAPVSGYFSRPKGAAKGSAAARVTFHGYGVRSAARRDAEAGDLVKPVLVLDVNAHGIDNGRPDDFYAELGRTTLKGYAFDSRRNARPETSYLNGMALRALRALEFLKAQPEWDGKTLIVSGGSQGGFQALLAAGLDSDVTLCEAWKPWLCDLGGVTLGRLKGWRPDYVRGLDYFDPINHAKRIRCETRITSGLGDYVCPPSGVTVLYNNLPGSIAKRLEYQQGATHGENPPGMTRHVVSRR